MDAYYTLNKQYHLLLRPVFWYQNDTRNINGKLSFKKWPTSFYGIGRDVETSSIETFTETLYETSIEAITQIIPGLFAGAGYSLRYGEITPDNDTGILAAGTIRGSGNTFISGLGGVLQYDTRDNHFYPESGSLHKFEIYTASKMIGSDYGFTRFTFDARRYISILHMSLQSRQLVCLLPDQFHFGCCLLLEMSLEGIQVYDILTGI
jgi:outer membrane protein assembly factor BamA